jgi:hypothetical protein
MRRRRRGEETGGPGRRAAAHGRHGVVSADGKRPFFRIEPADPFEAKAI